MDLGGTELGDLGVSLMNRLIIDHLIVINTWGLIHILSYLNQLWLPHLVNNVHRSGILRAENILAWHFYTIDVALRELVLFVEMGWDHFAFDFKV